MRKGTKDQNHDEKAKQNETNTIKDRLREKQTLLTLPQPCGHPLPYQNQDRAFHLDPLDLHLAVYQTYRYQKFNQLLTRHFQNMIRAKFKQN